MNLIYADFMKSDDQNRLVLTCFGTHRDLETNNIALTEGLELVFYNDDGDENGNPDNLVVSGVVEYDKEKERWTAKIDWDAIKNISQLSLEEKQKLSL